MAGALNFIGRETLFGRYWGAIEHHDCLHFELCYYQAMDHAIGLGLKLSRRARRAITSWRAAICRSRPIRCTGSRMTGFRDAVAEYLEAERSAVGQEIEVLTRYGPFRKITEDPE